MNSMERQRISQFEVGDKASIEIDNQEYSATVVLDDSRGCLFLLDSYLKKTYQMTHDDRGCTDYNDSDLRKILKKIGDEIILADGYEFVPFENGDIIRPLSLSEMCGCDKQFNHVYWEIPWLSREQNRITWRDIKHEKYWPQSDWGWLIDYIPNNRFAVVNGFGEPFASKPTVYNCVRPAFRLKNKRNLNLITK